MDAQFHSDNFDSVTVVPTGPAQNTSQPTSREIAVNNWVAATNPRTAPAVLDTLARTGIPQLLVRVAINHNTSPQTLSRIADHKAPEVRIAVAENCNVLIETLWHLAGDEDPDVRYALAENHNIPVELLQALTDDDNPYVSCRARRTLERLRNDMYMRGKTLKRVLTVEQPGPEFPQQANARSVQAPVSQFCSMVSRFIRSPKAACL